MRAKNQIIVVIDSFTYGKVNQEGNAVKLNAIYAFLLNVFFTGAVVVALLGKGMANIRLRQANIKMKTKKCIGEA